MSDWSAIRLVVWLNARRLVVLLGLLCFATERAAAQHQDNLQIQITAMDVSCATIEDGSIEVELLGGNRPVQFLWVNQLASLSGLGIWESGDPAILELNDLPAGRYNFAFRDADGDTLTTSVVLTAPEPIEATLSASADVCFGQNGGTISIESVSGGQAPYLAQLDNGPFTNQLSWTGLPGGTYFVTIMDAMGCERAEGVILPEAPGFSLDAGPDRELFSGDSVRIDLTADQPFDSISVQPNIGVLSIGASWVNLAPSASQQYFISVYDEEGCGAVDTVLLTVERERNVFFPNVFYPESPVFENRFFMVYTGEGVEAVESLRIWNRLGRLVYEGFNLEQNLPDAGWDGRSGVQSMPVGVYLWQATLRFTDGREQLFTGDVTLIR